MDSERQAAEATKIHLYECDGGPPWVFATSVDAARKELAKSDGYDDIAESANIVEVPSGEHFPMVGEHWDKDGLSPDCNHPVDETYGYCIEDCGEDRNTVTLTAAEWCNRFRTLRLDRVIGDSNDLSPLSAW